MKPLPAALALARSLPGRAMNHSLSIPNALKRDRPDDYHQNATIAWPVGPSGDRGWTSEPALPPATTRRILRL